MIDLHCHLLPGIDDGPRTLVESLNMARVAVDNGIHRAVLTPHLNPGRYENTRSSIELPLSQFRAALQKEQISLEISAAAEVRLSPDILPLIDRNEVPFLGEMDGYQIMLLEFPHSHIPLGSDNLVKRLLDRKIRPLIAHPERNKDVIRDCTKIEPFIEMGCLLQLTASAVAGRFGTGAHLRARQLLERDAVFVLATDAHNLKGRRPELREGVIAAAEIVGGKAAHAMVLRNPLAIMGRTHAAPH